MIEQEPAQTNARGGLRVWLLWGATVLAFGTLTWPVWRWLWSEWMSNDYYSHGVLIPPVALYLGWRRLQNEGLRPWRLETTDMRGPIVIAACLGIYVYFLRDNAYYLASFSVIGMLAGLMWAFGGAVTIRKLAFPLGFLVLMVPLPFVERVTLPLALFTGVCSTVLVKLLGLDIAVVGNAITLPNANLVIGAQCSGINSLIALTSLYALVAYTVQGPLWKRLVLVTLAVPIALLGNIVRVASLLVVARYWGADAAFVFYHDYSGIVFFVLALAAIVPLLALLRCRTLRPEAI